MSPISELTGWDDEPDLAEPNDVALPSYRTTLAEPMIPTAEATSSAAPAFPKPLAAPATPPPTYPTVKLTGFFQLNAAWFDQDEANIQSVGDIPDLTDFRRARLAAVGKVADNFAYMLEMDFAFPGRPSFMDVWVEAQDLSFGNVRVGQFRQPFGMDALTSVKELTFIDRSLPFVFLPFRQTGVMAYGTELDESLTWGVSGYRFQADPYGGVFGDAGYGMSTRVTTALVNDPSENYTIVLGGDFSHNRPSTGFLVYRQTPEIGFNFGVPAAIPFFVDTGLIRADSVNLFNLEAAFSYQGLLVQSEAILTQINQTGGDTAILSGWYAQASYVLTGEVRPFIPKQGVFGRVKPKHDLGPCGCGAWEIAGRCSHLDFNDGTIQGGRLTDLTLGLNWYFNSFMKLQFNYIHPFLDHPTVGNSNADVYALNAQLDF